MSSAIDPVTNLNDCGCCEGVSGETPAEVVNRPGLSAIAYRVGTHAQFKATMLARLSGSGDRALARLTTRDDDDFSIALLDAWATIDDVLTFYQERIANEAYLRTATERLSVLELARLIDYQLRPGVAASTYLAFALEEAPGALGQVLSIGTTAQIAAEPLPPIIIDVGTKVQSVPGPGEQAQTFETIEKIEARPEWNALKPRTTELIEPSFGDTSAYLKGISTNLKPGDILLFVGEERIKDPNSNRWDVRRIISVESQPDADRTKVIWDKGLGSTSPRREPAEHPKVFALRQRASIFGFNAPDWRGMPDSFKANYLGIASPRRLTAEDKKEWPDFKIYAPVYPPRTGTAIQHDAVKKAIVAELDRFTLHTRRPAPIFDHHAIDLDAVYQKITPGSWLLLSLPNDPNAKPTDPPKEFQQLHRVTHVAETARADFSLSAKTTRVGLDGLPVDDFEDAVRTTTVFAESEEMALAETPIIDPVCNRKVVLDRLVEGLQVGRKLMVTGKRMRRIRIGAVAAPLVLTPEDGSAAIQLKPGDEWFLAEPPAGVEGSFIIKSWRLVDQTCLKGFVNAPQTAITFVDSEREANKIVSELAILDSPSAFDDEHTELSLTQSLQNIYDPTSVIISANVAPGTHGETVQEVVGGGDATQAFQRFTLRQPPLTYVSASNPSGGQTTLEVRVNDVLWHEVPSFFDHSSEERIYVTRLDDEGKTTVIFGDGTTGARLPTGQENVTARYRKGIGLGGLAKADQLTQLNTRPLGVKGVTNPIAAAGAADRERLDEARRNAPLTVLTLGRVVSLKDYEDFARSFSGIDKALATWTWFGEKRGVFVTVAGSKGVEVKEDSKLHENLLKAMQKAGDPLVPLLVKSYQSRFFGLSAAIQVDPEFLPEKVRASVEQRLRDTYSFDARAFGQPVHLSEVIGVMQNVRGVVAVDVNEFYRSDQAVDRKTRIAAAVPRPGDQEIFPAELLTLDPQPLALEVSI